MTDSFSERYWVTSGSRKLLIYLGPHLHADLDRRQVREMLRLRRAYAALWSYDWDNGCEGPWYSVVCDRPDYDIETIENQSARYNIRRCLKTCQVRLIDAEWLADNGFDVHDKAGRRYDNYKPPTRESFATWVRSFVGRSDVEFFGVFLGEKIVAYAMVHLFGDTARVTASKFDPEYAKVKPMEGLEYTIAKHYLEREYRLVDSGTRPLLHSTSIDQFLERLGWRKAYCRLGLEMVPALRAAMCIARRVRPLCRYVFSPMHLAMLDGFLMAQDISRATSRSGKDDSPPLKGP